MNTRNTQQGSAHLIIIIVLAVAVLGLLGFVFWQNFVNTDDSNQAQTTQDSDASQLDSSFLELNDLGIKIPYISSEDTYTASEPNEFGAISIYSTVAADAGCTYEYNPDNDPAGSIGSVAGYDTDSEFFQGLESSEFFRVVTLEDKGYVLRSVQNTCGNDEAGYNPAGEAQEAAFLRFADQFEQLEEL